MDTELTPPRLQAYALVGHDDRLLLIPGPEPDVYMLPGGAVVSGEPVEQGLCRIVHQQLAMTVSDVDFYAAVEYGTTDPDHRLRSEVTLLFDVILTEPDHLTRPGGRVWVNERELTDITLHPRTVKDRLLQAPMSTRTSWWAWTP